jgi:peptide/nickel transport system substrate-binding protein
VIWLLLNHKNPHLAQPLVRQALMWGFDRQRVNAVLFEKSLVLARGYWPRSHPYASPEAKVYSYDPGRAIRLLKQAGYADKDRDGILDAPVKGRKQNLEFQVLSTDEEDGPLLDLFVQAMKKIGVRVTIDRKGAAEAARQVNEGNYEAYLLHVDRFYEDLNLRHQFHRRKKQKWPVIRMDEGAQKRLDSLLEDIEKDFDPLSRQQKQREVDRILSEQLPSLFLYEIPDEYWLKVPSLTEPPY